MADPRDPRFTVYPAPFLLWTGLFLFLAKLGSRRSLAFEFGTTVALQNLNRLAHCTMERLEHPDTLACYLERLPTTELPAFQRKLLHRLIRARVFDRYRLRGSLLVAIDASGTLSFTRRHCDHCLTQRSTSGVTTYHHSVLEAKLVTQDGLALSLASEFVENPAPRPTKQDCELVAFGRLAATLKKSYPQLRMCLLLDGLYAAEPVLRICKDNDWAYFITLKEGSMPAVFAEYERLRDLSPKSRCDRTGPDGDHQAFAWVNGMTYETHRFNVLECRETTPAGKSTRFVWLTNLTVDAASAENLANRGGRVRWKIENQGFNAQKHGGYNLEHAYSEDPIAGKNFYFLLQIAHLINQLLERSNLVPNPTRVYGSLAGFTKALLESLRGFVIPEHALDVQQAARIHVRLAPP